MSFVHNLPTSEILSLKALAVLELHNHTQTNFLNVKQILVLPHGYFGSRSRTPGICTQLKKMLFTTEFSSH